jgi:hypothetical protein
MLDGKGHSSQTAFARLAWKRGNAIARRRIVEGPENEI